MKISGKFEVTEVKKVTKAKLFKDLKVGDTICISKTLCSENPRFDVTRASYCVVENEKTKETVMKSFAELQNILPSFEWRQL